MTYKTTLILGALALAACGQESSEEQTEPQAPVSEEQRVDLFDGNGNAVGYVNYTEQDGNLSISVRELGVATGTHGVHLHETGLCEGPDFQSAGGHWNPTGNEHGRDNPNGAHLGDLANLTADDNGMVDFNYLARGVSTGSEQNTINDADGTALIVHAGPDDYRTDPSGDSGARMACAVLAAPQNGSAELSSSENEAVSG
ncbi:superoxide dismutase family protein [Sphingomicrobium sp. XHP0235]|uniref:superoxide dismutase family protein n=1 Tax=Sphingomicrobium aquimarinum TaxID=3133971 RepID=UPI0031FE9B76